MDHSNERIHVEEICSRKTPTLDWNALAIMKHKKRRATIKKFKRSIRRQRRVANSSSTIGDQKYDEEEWLRRESVARAEFLKSNEQKDNNILSDAALLETNIDHDVFLSAAEVPNVHIWNSKVSCPYFSRVGSCPHYPHSCTFVHEIPDKSAILLISNFFRHFALVEPCLNESSEEDMWLLYDKFELYQEFCDFFIDIENQLKEFGKLKKLIVCQNIVRHLRGNVYVEYAKQDEARAAMVGLYGRWYNRMQIYPRLVSVNWTDALCNEFVRFKKCQRNPTCYLLHPFQNPTPKRLFSCCSCALTDSGVHIREKSVVLGQIITEFNNKIRKKSLKLLYF
ncbi:U2 small nuclear ribonucleoprotein auxiliary factor 35 kDa subunit-related protein 1 [Trichinella spiralis]|uniref:U2 small nuclear ribonucleoprotein auxiliary factor 35 kDa subunit-related protein 1 n=1 Tax=Trichinella spiralis TaxID=6334 RepID=A0A0V1BMX8_TRISP|nr:U2 small nuclear ribonucleoprotein auxiliary factor 35 kDa subunit-related protein 1 [Trichinella spiralis]